LTILLPQGTFIAGVQASVISITWQSNGSTLEIVTNVFSFIGLVIDVLGTIIGVSYTGLLQEANWQWDKVQKSEAKIAEVLEWRNGVLAPSPSPASPTGAPTGTGRRRAPDPLKYLNILQQEVDLLEHIVLRIEETRELDKKFTYSAINRSRFWRAARDQESYRGVPSL